MIWRNGEPVCPSEFYCDFIKIIIQDHKNLYKNLQTGCVHERGAFFPDGTPFPPILTNETIFEIDGDKYMYSPTNQKPIEQQEIF